MSDTCHFCGAEEACYERREDGGTEYFPACEACARKPYPETRTVVVESPEHYEALTGKKYDPTALGIRPEFQMIDGHPGWKSSLDFVKKEPI